MSLFSSNSSFKKTASSMCFTGWWGLLHSVNTLLFFIQSASLHHECLTDSWVMLFWTSQAAAGRQADMQANSCCYLDAYNGGESPCCSLGYLYCAGEATEWTWRHTADTHMFTRRERNPPTPKENQPCWTHWGLHRSTGAQAAEQRPNPKIQRADSS